ncbi:unnamed protein product, partial [Closterium sp. NIES-53]
MLAFDHEGRPLQFDTWLDDLQLYLLSDSRDSVSLFDHTSGTAPAPPATASTIPELSASVQLTVKSSPPLVRYELGEYRCPPGCDGHYHHSWGSACVDLHVYTDGSSPGHVHSSARVESVHTGYRASSGSCVSSGVRIRSCCTPLLVSPPVAPDFSVAPPPWSPLPATPSWHALPSPCLWFSETLASPPALACPALPSFCRGAEAQRSSLLLVSPDDCSPIDSPHGRVGPSPRQWTGQRALLSAVRLQLRERFRADLPILHLHSDRGGEFSSDLLRDFCRGEGILQSVTLPASPQQNGIAEHRIGLVMEVARTSTIHAAAPHFLWPFAVRYAAHQLNLWLRVSFPENSPTLRWTLKVGDASVFRFYHPTSRRVFPSQDVTFDESVPFYHLFSYHSAPPPPLFLAPGPPPVDPLLPQGPAPLGLSQVDPLPCTALDQVAAGSGAARGAVSGGAESGGAEPEASECEGARVADSEGAEFGGTEPQGAALSGGPAGALPRLSMHQLREWLVRRARLRSGATRPGGTGAARAGGAGVTDGAAGTGGPAPAGHGGARTRGSGPGGAGAGGAGAGGTGVGGAGAGGTYAGGARAGGAGVGGPGAGGAGAGGGAVDPGGTMWPRPYFVPLLQQVLGVPSSPSLTRPLLCPPPDQSQLPLQSASPLPATSPYIKQSGGLTERHELASRHASPVRTTHCVPRSRPPPIPGTHAMALRPSFVPLPPPPDSSLPEVPDPKSDLARAASPTASRIFATAVADPSFESAVVSALVAELLDFAAACRRDYATALVAESECACPPSVR